jgi:YVTN family beta-propeller protein
MRREHREMHKRDMVMYKTRAIGAMALILALLYSLGIRQIHAAANNAHAPPLQAVGDYPLTGRATRWDYMSLDTPRSQLFIAHLGDSSVVVVNTKTKSVITTIANIGSVHGTLAVPELNTVYASATKTNEVVAIDANTLKITARIPGGVYPDGMAYAPDVHKLYVSDEHGNTETVIDARSNKRIATIQLGGNVGNTQYDPVSKHIFVNVQGTGELIEIDPKTDVIIHKMVLAGADGNHGLFIEPTLRLAFIACEDNNKLLVMNLDTRKIVARFDLGKGPDVLAYDSGLGVLYVASESGTLSRFKAGTDGVTKVSDEFIGPNAHTLAVDSSNHEVYFSMNKDGQQPVLRVLRPMS